MAHTFGQTKTTNTGKISAEKTSAGGIEVFRNLWALSPVPMPFVLGGCHTT